jgi:hypothetical protein
MSISPFKLLVPRIICRVGMTHHTTFIRSFAHPPWSSTTCALRTPHFNDRKKEKTPHDHCMRHVVYRFSRLNAGVQPGDQLSKDFIIYIFIAKKWKALHATIQYDHAYFGTTQLDFGATKGSRRKKAYLPLETCLHLAIFFKKKIVFAYKLK